MQPTISPVTASATTTTSTAGETCETRTLYVMSAEAT